MEFVKLLSLLEAARWAPSSGNGQPWSFMVALKQDGEEYVRLLSCLNEGNRRWADKAPVLMLSIANTRRGEHNEKENLTALHDLGLAVGSLLVQATAEGFVVHQMAGFDAARARALYAMPDTYRPVAAIAVGYQADPSALPDDLQARELPPGIRKPLSDVVYSRRFGSRAAILASPRAEGIRTSEGRR